MYKKKPKSDSKIILEVEGIGEVEIKRRKGQKSTNLRLSKGGVPVVSSNYSTPVYALKDFIKSNKDWIVEHKEKSGLSGPIQIYNGQSLSTKITFEIVEGTSFMGDLEPDFGYRKGKESIKIKGLECFKENEDELYVEINEDLRRRLEPVVVKALRHEAQEVLPLKLSQWANVMGVDYNNLTIRNTSSRWGSCSYSNNINLSLWLMLLPANLIDYVVIHELAHVKFKNHKAEFWNEVGRYSPNYKDLRSRLKKHARQVWW